MKMWELKWKKVKMQGLKVHLCLDSSMAIILAWNLSGRDLSTFLTILGSGICSPRLKVELTISFSLTQNSLNVSSSSIFISSNLVVSLQSFESLTALVLSQVIWRMVHASLAVSVEDIFLNSSLVTSLNMLYC